MTIDLNVSEYVKQLERIGPLLTEQQAQRILRAGPAAVTPLLTEALNTEALKGEAPRRYAPLHALRLLGELRDPAIIAPLFGHLPQLEDFYDEQLAFMWTNELPQIVARIGPAVAETLWALVDDETQVQGVRAAALDALGYLTRLAPETRAATVAGMRERLAASGDNQLLTTALATGLGNLGAAEAYADVIGAYRAGRVNAELLPPGQARQLLLTNGERRLACVLHTLEERYAQHALDAPPQ